LHEKTEPRHLFYFLNGKHWNSTTMQRSVEKYIYGRINLPSILAFLLFILQIGCPFTLELQIRKDTSQSKRHNRTSLVRALVLQAIPLHRLPWVSSWPCVWKVILGNNSCMCVADIIQYCPSRNVVLSFKAGFLLHFGSLDSGQ
jgi:hypothetical protein